MATKNLKCTGQIDRPVLYLTTLVGTGAAVALTVGKARQGRGANAAPFRVGIVR